MISGITETAKPSYPVIIGLAGTSCAGKNTAAEILKERGWHIIDADEISGKVFAIHEEEICTLFSGAAAEKGVRLKDKDGKPDKKKISRLVFSEPNLLKKLEDFIIPKIVFEAEKKIEDFFKESPETPIVLNAPTLHKTSLLQRCLFVLYIDAPFILRVIRALKRDKISIKEVFLRFLNQRNFFSQYIFLKADILKVKNTGSAERLKQNIGKALSKRGF